jgi:hypothetical protein
MNDPSMQETRSLTLLDKALVLSLTPPDMPLGFRESLNEALAREREFTSPITPDYLQSEHRRRMDALRSDYIRMRRTTFGTLIGVAFASGSAAAALVPWALTVFGSAAALLVPSAGASFGVAMFLRVWARRET